MAASSISVRAAVAAGLLVAAPIAASPGATVPLDSPIAQAEPATRFLPNPEDMALPSERPVMNQLFAKLATSQDPEGMLLALDEALAGLRQPTRLRGFVQFNRAGLLLLENEYPPAIRAIEESIRLLPGYSGPLIAAASVYAYSNQPGKGADYLIRASQVDADSVQAIDDYEVNNLLHRLGAEKDERRLIALSDRLLEIGWTGTRLTSESRLARQAIDYRLRAGDVAGARALVPRLLVPSNSYGLLISNAYAPLWPDIEQWAGAMLEKQWPIYLNEAQARWSASRDVSTSGDYVGALGSAGHYDTIIEQMLPLFSQEVDPRQDQDLIFIVTQVANALASKGRWDEVDALFRRGGEIWPLGSQANALNIAANRAKYLLYADRTEEALVQIDAAIADTRRWGPEVNMDALAAMHHYRACMLHQLGRGPEAGISMALASGQYPGSRAMLHLCMDDTAEARRTLIAGLEQEVTRDNVLSFVQKIGSDPYPSAYSRKMRARTEELKRDPALLAEVAKYGRVLAFSVNERAPPEKR